MIFDGYARNTYKMNREMFLNASVALTQEKKDLSKRVTPNSRLFGATSVLENFLYFAVMPFKDSKTFHDSFHEYF